MRTYVQRYPSAPRANGYRAILAGSGSSTPRPTYGSGGRSPATGSSSSGERVVDNPF